MAWIAIAVGGALGSVAGAALNVIVQVAGGLLAVWVGYQSIRWKRPELGMTRAPG